MRGRADAIALAVRLGCKIFVHEEFFRGLHPHPEREDEDEVEKFREFSRTLNPEDFQ